ncbi:NUDIX domain-containing protein [Candidatus Dependentiae bacterium]|nr:NUDIX domain-containing protein [Candidatus Dependentiae bacterium]
MSSDEILDIVSFDDKVIGQEKRSIIHAKELSSYRVVNGFICNTKNQLWIPRRHPQKELFPLHLDASVCGHVRSGETYDEAFIRETREELNLELASGTYSTIARLTPYTHGTSGFMWVYIIKSDVTPTYNTNDFVEFFWLSPDEFFTKVSQGDKARSDLLPILQEIKHKL